MQEEGYQQQALQATPDAFVRAVATAVAIIGERGDAGISG